MKKRTFLRLSGVLLCLCLLFSVLLPFLPTADAAVKITQTVNLSRPGKNLRGNGYTWDNRAKTLTLDGLYIETNDEYGLKVADDATVILVGDNYIKASGAALALAGDVLFKGNGSLTLVSENMGMYFYSTNENTVARFLSGTYKIDAAGHGVYSPYTALSFVDGKWTVTAASNALEGHTFKLYGGKMNLEGAVHATTTLDVKAISLSVKANGPALVSDKALKISEVSLQVGADKSSLAKAENYSGEACIVTKSARSSLGHSLLFGENVPMFVDILILVLFLLLIAAGIALPFLRARKKAEEAKAALAAIEAEAEAARRAEKAARKKH